MQTITLPISVSANAALNADNTTLLRSLNVQQGEIYQVNLAFFSGNQSYSPNLGEFAFYLRAPGSPTNLIAVNTLSGSGFTLDLSTPPVALSLGYAKSKDFHGLLSFTDGSTLDVIEPFNIRIANSYGGITGVIPSYVGSLNGVLGAVTLAAAGTVTISQSGQVITLSGALPDLSDFASIEDLETTNDDVAELQSQTGTYYAASNPSGFATQTCLNTASFTLQSQITALIDATGNYYPVTNPNGYLSLDENGYLNAQSISDTGASSYFDFANAQIGLGGAGAEAQTILDLRGGNLFSPNEGGVTLDFENKQLLGNWNLGDATGALATTGELAGLSGLVALLESKTGSYYPASNPSGFGAGGGGTATSVSGSGFLTTLQVAESGASSSFSWNPAVLPALYVNNAATITLPTTSASLNGVVGFIKNVTASSSVTLSATSSIWINSKAITSFTLLPGQGLTLVGLANDWMAVAGFSYPRLLADGNLTAQTAAATVVSLVPLSDSTVGAHSYSVAPYLNVASRTTDVIAMSVTWFDEGVTSRTQAFYPQGATVSGVSAVGFVAYSPVTIRAEQGTTIAVVTTLPTAGGSISYDAGATITQLE